MSRDNRCAHKQEGGDYVERRKISHDTFKNRRIALVMILTAPRSGERFSLISTCQSQNPTL